MSGGRRHARGARDEERGEVPCVERTGLCGANGRRGALFAEATRRGGANIRNDDEKGVHLTRPVDFMRGRATSGSER